MLQVTCTVDHADLSELLIKEVPAQLIQGQRRKPGVQLTAHACMAQGSGQAKVSECQDYCQGDLLGTRFHVRMNSHIGQAGRDPGTISDTQDINRELHQKWSSRHQPVPIWYSNVKEKRISLLYHHVGSGTFQSVSLTLCIYIHIHMKTYVCAIFYVCIIFD